MRLTPARRRIRHRARSVLDGSVNSAKRTLPVVYDDVYVVYSSVRSCSRWISADARHTGLPSDAFDLVHARTLLVTIPGPAEVVTEMVRLARPGGWVAGQEADAELALCYP